MHFSSTETETKVEVFFFGLRLMEVVWYAKKVDPGGSRKGPIIKQGLFFLPSFPLSSYLGILLELYRQFFLNFGMGLETHWKFWITGPDFSKNLFLPKKFGKCTENGPETVFFEFIEKFNH